MPFLAATGNLCPSKYGFSPVDTSIPGMPAKMFWNRRINYIKVPFSNKWAFTYHCSNVLFSSVCVFFGAIKHMFRVANTFLSSLQKSITHFPSITIANGFLKLIIEITWYLLLNSEVFSKSSMQPSAAVYPKGHGFGGSQ